MSIYITINRNEIEKFHAAGIREIAIRDGKEYVLKKSEIETVGARFTAPEGEDHAENR